MQARGIEEQKSFLEKAELWGKQTQVLQTSLVLPYSVPYNSQWPLAVLELTRLFPTSGPLHMLLFLSKLSAWVAVLSLI